MRAPGTVRPTAQQRPVDRKSGARVGHIGGKREITYRDQPLLRNAVERWCCIDHQATGAIEAQHRAAAASGKQQARSLRQIDSDGAGDTVNASANNRRPASGRGNRRGPCRKCRSAIVVSARIDPAEVSRVRNIRRPISKPPCQARACRNRCDVRTVPAHRHDCVGRGECHESAGRIAQRGSGQHRRPGLGDSNARPSRPGYRRRRLRPLRQIRKLQTVASCRVGERTAHTDMAGATERPAQQKIAPRRRVEQPDADDIAPIGSRARPDRSPGRIGGTAKIHWRETDRPTRIAATGNLGDGVARYRRPEPEEAT